MTTSSLHPPLAAARRFTRRYGQPLWVAGLTICAAIFFFQGRSDLSQAMDAISGSSPVWFGPMIAAQLAILIFAAGTYRIVLRHIGHRLGLRRLFALHMERKVIGTVVPAGGPASVYVFVRGLGRDKVSSEDALFTIGVRSLMGFSSFISLLLPAIVFVRPDGYLLAGGLGLIGSFVLLVGAIAWLTRRPATLRRIEQRVPARATGMVERLRDHRLGLNDLGMPYLLALLSQLANAATLAAALYALGHSPSIVSILAAYTVGTAAVTLAPAFQGIGIVEVSMAVTLQQFGIPPGIAIGATLLYRGGTVWFPLLLGAVFQAGRWIPIDGSGRFTIWSRQRLAAYAPIGFFSSGVAAALVLAALVIVL
ncbi:MAG: lysylphosphatidylglycerol synthase transmembrane domain-containing protein [Thermomicrobiales bacterium]